MLKLKRYHDPGHSWLAVKRAIVVKYATRISHCSYERGETVYLEEDDDMCGFLRALRDAGVLYSIEDRHTDKPARIRSYASFALRAGECIPPTLAQCQGPPIAGLDAVWQEVSLQRDEFIRDHFVFATIGFKSE